jgi:hypothetical protein
VSLRTLSILRQTKRLLIEWDGLFKTWEVQLLPLNTYDRYTKSPASVRTNFITGYGVVTTVTRLWAGQSGVLIPAGTRDMPLLPPKKKIKSRWALGSRKEWVPGIKRPRREAHHLLPTINEAMPPPHTYLHGVHGKNFTFTFTFYRINFGSNFARTGTNICRYSKRPLNHEALYL